MSLKDVLTGELEKKLLPSQIPKWNKVAQRNHLQGKSVKQSKKSADASLRAAAHRRLRKNTTGIGT